MKRNELKVGQQVVLDEGGAEFLGEVVLSGIHLAVKYMRQSGKVVVERVRYYKKTQRYQASHGGTNGVYGLPVIVSRVV